MGTRTLELCLSSWGGVIIAGTSQGFFVPLPFFPLSLHYFLYFRCRILGWGMLRVSETWHAGVWSTAAGAGCWVLGARPELQECHTPGTVPADPGLRRWVPAVPSTAALC